MGWSLPRAPAVATSYPGEHVVRSTEPQPPYPSPRDGEVEGELDLAAVDPGGARTVSNEDREGSRRSAVEEAGHLVGPLEARRRAKQPGGGVGGDHHVRRQQL